jgi:hypothetical protein
MFKVVGGRVGGVDDRVILEYNELAGKIIARVVKKLIAWCPSGHPPFCRLLNVTKAPFVGVFVAQQQGNCNRGIVGIKIVLRPRWRGWCQFPLQSVMVKNPESMNQIRRDDHQSGHRH